jgi:Ribosomal protein L4
MEEPKTKEFISILNNIKANGRKVLFILPEKSDNIYLSSRNLENVKVMTAADVNTYEVMLAYNLVLVDGAQDAFQVKNER